MSTVVLAQKLSELFTEENKDKRVLKRHETKCYRTDILFIHSTDFSLLSFTAITSYNTSTSCFPHNLIGN